MFKAINYILFEKSKSLDSEILEEFQPYMVGRYLSMYDNSFVPYVNDTLNMYGHLFENNVEQFTFYEQIVPKLKRKKINYIKRKKHENNEEDVINRVPEFLSKREMKEYREYGINRTKIL
jgi:hypothetical protein